MLKSMTGFGRGEYADEKLSFTIEMKAVNHRYNEIAIRLPRVLNPLEDRVRRQIANAVNRGRVDVFINMSDNSTGKCSLKIDRDLAVAYHNALKEVASAVELKAEVPDWQELLFIMRSSGVVSTEETTSDAEDYWEALSTSVALAIDNLLRMREVEGANIYHDLCVRINTIERQLQLVEDRAPEVVKEFHVKITERVNELLKDVQQTIDQDKILHEVAIFADKTSITEEIVRLKSHIKQFRAAVDFPGAVGRKLDFIIQEFNREVNTIASKANDSTITQITVEMKSEIEKIREQIQNIE